MNRVLIASPIPSHPQDQGNSARIHALGRILQSAGIIVHFLYYAMEGLTPGQRAAMEACWDHFHAVPCAPRATAPGANGVYRLDDWWDPAVAAAARELHRRWRFGAVIANYVWFSAVLDAFGSDVVKVLDTHDVFGGRADRFRAAGLEPEWFYTTPAEEARGLARADIVLAIQDEEAGHFRGLGHGDVRLVGHLPPFAKRSPRPVAASVITAGYLASGNPINVSSFERLRHRLASGGAPGMKLMVAGAICDKLPVRPEPFAALGRVDDVASFYDAVDLVINPMTFGTGLKIKSVEAVFQGLPLVATAAAMTGLPARHPYHRFASVEALADRLAAFGTDDLADLAQASWECRAEYSAGVRAAFRELIAAIAR
ncbi:MAG TPA: glycosyltransferase [Stellaceae bacterium]|nr:glycosyltransferase [Stellaceae bacterium]